MLTSRMSFCACKKLLLREVAVTRSFAALISGLSFAGITKNRSHTWPRRRTLLLFPAHFDQCFRQRNRYLSHKEARSGRKAMNKGKGQRRLLQQNAPSTKKALRFGCWALKTNVSHRRMKERLSVSWSVSCPTHLLLEALCVSDK